MENFWCSQRIDVKMHWPSNWVCFSIIYNGLQQRIMLASTLNLAFIFIAM